ncbi:hypothetical protein IAR55_005411 [Kwoniella newhampshirensis]|uniref:Type 2A phosphatase activator TIP41 n=1 Tax=Kwoniella newhampshirensis TaxID=1651941 RepID=A0AAW0YVI3_9TREE
MSTSTSFPSTAAPPPSYAPAPAQARPPSSPFFSLTSSKYSNKIAIGPWRIEATKKPILNGKEIDAAEKMLNLPLPEMTFGNNSLSLTYDPSSSSSSSGSISTLRTDSNSSSNCGEEDKVEIHFRTLDALAGVAVGEGWEERVGGGVLVSMAEKWGKSRSSSNSMLSDTPLPAKPVKPHDWTYSTCYAGSVAGPSTFRVSPTRSLPLSLLARQDPDLDKILYYDDVPLFEDELHDNGESMLNVRIRVMPHSFFILARLFVRVDDVLFRMYDVRIYHAFGSDEVVREISGMEANYEEIKRQLEKPSDLSPLTSPNWVYGVMTSLSSLPSRPNLAHRSSSSSRGGKPWPGLGKKVEVLVLPKPREGVDKAMDGLQKVTI